VAHWIVGSVIRLVIRSAASPGEFDGLGDLVGGSADGDSGVVSQVSPDFVGVGQIERFAWIST